MALATSTTEKEYEPKRRQTLPLTVYRVARGWSQQEIADRSGLTKRTVNRVERGRGVPTLKTAAALSAVLDVPIEALFPPRSDDQEAPD